MGYFRKSLFLLLCAAMVAFSTGCRSTRDDFTPYVVRLYVEESPNLPPSHITNVILPISNTVVTVGVKPKFAEWDVLTAAAAQTEFGPGLVIFFTQAASKDLFRQSISNQGRRIVLTVNTVPIAARVMDRPIQDGQIMFFPEIDMEEFPELLEGIQRTAAEIQDRIKKGRW